MKIATFYKSSICFLYLVYAGIVCAQKLPNIQENSQWLPEIAKIDGKFSEWNDLLQAFNKATGVEYTIANDDKNLYLAVRSKDKGTTAKIMVGGITFMMNTSGRSVNEGQSITFPVTPPGFSKEGWPVYRLPLDSTDIQNAIVPFKEIKVFGFKGVSDSILSIYNEYNIKTKLTYSNGALISELVIPFDLIGLSSQGLAAFSYAIRLNGITPPKPGPGAPPPPPMIIPGRDADPALLERIQIETQVSSPTDLSGKYTLLRK